MNIIVSTVRKQNFGNLMREEIIRKRVSKICAREEIIPTRVGNALRQGRLFIQEKERIPIAGF
jgi:hypothetical protein